MIPIIHLLAYLKTSIIPISYQILLSTYYMIGTTGCFNVFTVVNCTDKWETLDYRKCMLYFQQTWQKKKYFTTVWLR